MARRRKSTANSSGKLKDTAVKNTEKKSSSSSTNNPQENEDNCSAGPSEAAADSAPKPQSETVSEEVCVTNAVNESVVNNNCPQSEMMLLDINQMILGDGQGEEIRVERHIVETVGESTEEEVMEYVEETETFVETSREDEYLAPVEEDEDENVVYINPEGEEESQYVVLEIDSSGEASARFINLEDLPSEIRTIERESDYESSQESVNGTEDEQCDNINSVIGTSGDHVVNYSPQYNSFEELDSHQGSAEKEEITVTEHEAVLGYSKIETEKGVEKYVCSNIEMVEISNNLEVPNDNNALIVDESENFLSKKSEKLNVEENSIISVRLTETVSKEENNKLGEGKSAISSDNIERDSEVVGDSCRPILNSDKEVKKEMDVDDIQTKIDKPSSVEKKILPKRKGRASVKSKAAKSRNNSSNKVNKLKLKSDEQKEEDSSIHNTDSKGTFENHSPDSSIETSATTAQLDKKPISISSESSNSSKLDQDKCSRFTKNQLESVSKTLQNIQEQKITSNSNVSESKLLNLAPPLSPKKESNSNSPLTENFSLQSGSNKLEDKVESASKNEITVKTEEEKSSSFRSRSGSTDTTGSESGSNSGSSRRRSGRIKSIAAVKSTEVEVIKPASVTSVPVVTSTTMTPPVPVPSFESDKPVKVKSRWRRSSELEMGSHNRHKQEQEVIMANARLTEREGGVRGRPSTPPDTPPSDREESYLNFQRITCNEYLTDRSKSKDAKKMVCDCTLSKEEIARGEMGCGEYCLNRMLMIECGTRCSLGDKCGNKRFQNLENAKCEVFKTEKKGFGLRALEDIPIGTFLMEYVGEVLDPKEFRRRAKDYSKDKNLHFYFMALKSDSIIDATQKGNISRFINHSCEPNAETQKWTVNGELRIGFFSMRSISAGEEITFDYQFERYGKEAQRCFCETQSCRGWIGEDPEKENKWSDSSGRTKERKERKKKEDKRLVVDLDEEIEKLVLKNKEQTLHFSRLMVRAEDARSRSQMLRVLREGETACRRLFLDYHGLSLLWGWMMDQSTTLQGKAEILETLATLPIPNKTMLQDSKVLGVVEKWSTMAHPVADGKDRSSTEEECDKVEEKDKQTAVDKNSDDSNSSKPVETEEQQEELRKKVIDLANSLLQEWSSLKEVYRIPKKERIEQMKEHEREADKVGRDSSVESQDRSYDRHWSQDKYRNDYDRRDRKRGRDSPDSDRSRKSTRSDDKQPQLTKMERRQLFAIKVAQEEEERLRRQHEDSVWQEQVQLAAQELAQQQANTFPPPFQQWPFPPPDGNIRPPLPVQHMDQPMFGPMNPPNHPPPPFMFNQPGPQMLQHPPFLEPNINPPFLEQNHNSPFQNQGPPLFNHPPPLPKQPLLPTPNQPLLPTPNQPLLPRPNQPLIPTPNQPLLPTPNQPMLPTPPLPNQPLLPTPNQPPPMSNQHYQHNEVVINPPLPNHPLQQNQPVQICMPPFTSQPPLPRQPPPVVMTNQPPPVNPQQFQNAVPVQNQFSQPPPPLPALPPTPAPVSTVPMQFQPPLPQTTAVSAMPVFLPAPIPLPLPPKWKSAKDPAGRTYYYHVKTRISQWEPPVWEHQLLSQKQKAVVESDSDSSSSDSEDDDSSSEEEQEQEEEKVEEEESEPVETVEEDLGVEELGDSPYEPETMELVEDIMEDDYKRKRKSDLVQERIISPRTADEIPDKLDKRKIRELKEKLRRQKAKERLRQKQKSKSRSSTSKCEADTSSEPGRKIKEAFRLSMAGVIVHYLNAYRKPDCKLGKITNTGDFKHLARKLTHFVMLKELKHCRSVDELECNDNVKHKARDFIKKYMAKFGPVYQRPSDDD